MHKILLTFSLINFCLCKINMSSSIDEFTEYFSNLKLSNKKHHAIVNVNFTRDDDVINKLIAEKYISSTVEIYNDPKKAYKEEFQFSHVYIFVNNLEDIVNITEIFLKNQIQGHGNRKFHYLVRNILHNDTRNLKNILKLFWIKHQILNYVIILPDQCGSVQICLYHPYQNRIIKFTNKTLTEDLLFPNKLRNLYGYKLKLQMFHVNDTLQLKGDNDCLGIDCDNMKYFFQFLNATHKRIPLDENVTLGYYFRAGISAIKSDRIDILANSVVIFPEHLPYSFSTFRQIQMEIVLPKAPAIPIFANIFHVYDLDIWICWSVLKLLFFCFLYLFKKFIHFHSYGIKILLVLYFLYSIEFINSFQGSIITALIKPRYKKNIDTLDELIQSGIPIYSEHSFIEYMAENYKKHFRRMHYNGVEARLMNLTMDGAYLVPTYWVDLLMRKKTIEGVSYSELYHVVKEKVSGISIMGFLVRNKSPYREILRELSVRRLDFGLDLSFGKTETIVAKSKTPTILTLEHFKGALILLSIGLGCSLITFILELVYVNSFKYGYSKKILKF